MKISRIIIKDYQQFGLLDLDLTYPEGHEKAGQPLEKVCFIGRNGTGKTTLLKILENEVASLNSPIRLGDNPKNQPRPLFNNGTCIIGLTDKNRSSYIARDVNKGGIIPSYRPQELNSLPPISHISNLKADNLKEYWTPKPSKWVPDYFEQHGQPEVVYSPYESASNQLLSTGLIPNTRLDNAMKLFNALPKRHSLSYDQIAAFWDLVIYQVKKREADRQKFENRPENLDKTKRELTAEFDAQNPEFLKHLAEIWNEILQAPGLEFDYEEARIPIQLTDNLQAHIKLKKSGNPIPYSALSSGIRHFLYRIGYFAAIYFNRKVNAAFAFFDEPEASLFPDLQYNIVQRYVELSENTQFFFATHSPIIAGQFEPCERIILDFDDEAMVTAQKGHAAEGDDPNDVLLQDFGLESVMGPKGKEKWEEFIGLIPQIKSETNKEKRKALIKQYLEIGQAYNFIIDEKGEQKFGL